MPSNKNNNLGNISLNNYKKKKDVIDVGKNLNGIDFDTDLELEKKPSEYWCTCCGKKYTNRKDNFPKTYSVLFRGNEGYFSVCKSCIDKYYYQLVDFFCKDENAALDRMCQIMDLYFCQEGITVVDSMIDTKTSKATRYPKACGMRQVKRKGTDYTQTLKDRNLNNAKITSIDGVSHLFDDDESPIEEFKVTREIVKTWGKGYTPDEYEYLCEQYSDWCAKNVCNTKSQEEIYKNIAYAQLNIRRAQQSGGKVSDAQKALQDLMSSAAILPKQTAENVLADTQSFGTLLKKFEETEPIPEPSERWKDVDGIRKYINAWVKGGLAKSLKIRNKNTEFYDEELEEYKKYTVNRVGYEESNIIDAYNSENKNGSE